MDRVATMQQTTAESSKWYSVTFVLFGQEYTHRVEVDSEEQARDQSIEIVSKAFHVRSIRQIPKPRRVNLWKRLGLDEGFKVHRRKPQTAEAI